MLRTIFICTEAYQELRKNSSENCCIACQAVFCLGGEKQFTTQPQLRDAMRLLVKALDTLPPAIRDTLKLKLLREQKEGIHSAFEVTQEALRELFSDEKNEVSVSEADMATGSSLMKNTVADLEGGRRMIGALMDVLSETTSFKNTKVVRDGEKIILPKDMSCPQAIDVLTKQMKEEETEIEVDIAIDCFPFEGARAFQTAIAREFGWVNRVPIPGFFSSSPPAMVMINTDVDKTESVMWGRIEIPAISGYLQTEVTLRENRFWFRIGGVVKKKSIPLVEKLGELTKQEIKANSIYRGKAVRFSFPDPKDESTFDINNSPKFIDTSLIKSDELIFSDVIQAQVERAIFNPIECTEICRKNGIPLKRGTLLAGKFGVGKTQAAYVTAKKCIENGWTFFYLEKPEQLAAAIPFARQYQPAVIFVEDIDKVTKGSRDKALDELLNKIDGVDTKGGELMLVFTTNQLEVINRAVLRAGRLDDIVEVLPPDEMAVARLIQLYARGLLEPNQDLSEVASRLAGQIPATIADVCTRAQLSAAPRAKKSDGKIRLTARDLETAANGKLHELKLVAVEQPVQYGTSVEKAASILTAGISAVINASENEKTTNGKTPKQLSSSAS